MKEDTKRQLKDFFKICWMRLETGERISADHYAKIDLFDEITQELADIANYAFLEYVKISQLREKARRLSEPQPSS
jgi:hypothetical protein